MPPTQHNCYYVAFRKWHGSDTLPIYIPYVSQHKNAKRTADFFRCPIWMISGGQLRCRSPFWKSASRPLPQRWSAGLVWTVSSVSDIQAVLRSSNIHTGSHLDDNTPNICGEWSRKLWTVEKSMFPGPLLFLLPQLLFIFLHIFF